MTDTTRCPTCGSDDPRVWGCIPGTPSAAIPTGLPCDNAAFHTTPTPDTDAFLPPAGTDCEDDWQYVLDGCYRRDDSGVDVTDERCPTDAACHPPDPHHTAPTPDTDALVEAVRTRLCAEPFCTHPAPDTVTCIDCREEARVALDALASQLKTAREERDRWETTATHLLDRAEAAEAQAADALAVCEEHRQAWLDAVGAAPWCEECGMRYDGKTALCPRCTKLARVTKAADALADWYEAHTDECECPWPEPWPTDQPFKHRPACPDGLLAAYRAAKEETP